MTNPAPTAILTIPHPHPFGMLSVGRKWSTGDGFRYGFNSQEQDIEITGDCNILTAKFWEYDSRIARRWNRDVIRKPWLSPYSTIFNNPILYSDLEGNIGEPATPTYKTGLDYRGGGDDDLLYNVIGKAGDIERPRRNKKEATLTNGPDNPSVPSTKEGREQVEKYDKLSNKELGRNMSDAFQYKISGNWIPYAQPIINHFASNSGETFSTYVDSKDVPIGVEWAILKSGIRDGIFEEYIRKGQPLEQFDISAYIQPPDFSGEIMDNRSLTTIIGVSNEVEVILHSIEVFTDANGQVEFTADVEIIIRDWFGVSEKDFVQSDYAGRFGRKALTCFWILQHRRGYKPFINEFHFKDKIHGSRSM